MNKFQGPAVSQPASLYAQFCERAFAHTDGMTAIQVAAWCATVNCDSIHAAAYLRERFSLGHYAVCDLLAQYAGTAYPDHFPYPNGKPMP